MKTLEEFEQFYENTLKKRLAPFARRRRNLLLQLLALTVPLMIISGAVINYHDRLHWDYKVPMGTVMASALIVGLWLYFKAGNYTERYQSKIVPEIVRFLDDRLRYVDDQGISTSTFVASRLFRKKPHDMGSEGKVVGRLGAVSIQFGEVDAAYTKYGSGSESDDVSIFKGLFFTASFDDPIGGQTVVLPDALERFLGRFGKKIQSLDWRWGKQVTLPDKQFEKYFEVYAKDVKKAKKLFTAPLMERLCNYRKASRNRVHLSIIDATLYVAIESWSTFFRPRFYRSPLSFRPLRDYYHAMGLLFAIIEDISPSPGMLDRAPKAAAPAADPARVAALVKKGLLCARKGKLPLAVKALSAAIDLDAAHAAARFNRGVLYLKSGAAVKGVADLKVAAAQGHPRAQKMLSGRNIPWRVGGPSPSSAPSPEPVGAADGTDVAIIGEPKIGVGQVEEMVSAFGKRPRRMPPYPENAAALFCISGHGSRPSTLNALRAAAGQRVAPAAMVLTASGPTGDDDLAELVVLEFREMLKGVMPPSLVKRLPLLTVSEAGFNAALKQALGNALAPVRLTAAG